VAVKFQQPGQNGQHQTDAKAEVGNKHGQAGKYSDRQGQVQSEQGKTHAVKHGRISITSNCPRRY
jgi:hypothetical protein